LASRSSPSSPVGRGFLTGQIKSPEDFPPDDIRRNLPRFQGANFQKNLDLVTKVKDLATEKRCTPAQLALAWVLGRADHIIPLFGTKRRTFLQENLGALNVRLTPEDLRRLDAAFPKDAAAGARYGESAMKTVNG
jgi:aryl-alcohol dehydrogenase-like predicted oxidoreductase